MSSPAPARRTRSAWPFWLVGIALFVGVLLVALHVSEAGSYARVLVEARPGWLALAATLQGATYLAQGLIWRAVVRAGGLRLSVGVAYRLSLVKLLVDQTLPSSGLSGSVVVATALRGQGVPEAVTTAGIVVGAAGYLLAYSTSVLAGLALLARRHAVPASMIVVVTAVLATVAALVFAAIRTAWPKTPGKRRHNRAAQWLIGRLHPLDRIDAALARNPRLLALSVGLQLGIIVLDSLTMWTLVRSLGADAPVAAVFSSFMVASVLRTLSVIPGGLGTFEAASVFTLHSAGLAVPVALSATLLFRVLSFWLPMAPGAWLARGFMREGAALPGMR